MAKKAVKAKAVKVAVKVEKPMSPARLEALRLAALHPLEADMTVKRAGEYLKFLKGEDDPVVP